MCALASGCVGLMRMHGPRGIGLVPPVDCHRKCSCSAAGTFGVEGVEGFIQLTSPAPTTNDVGGASGGARGGDNRNSRRAYLDGHQLNGYGKQCYVSDWLYHASMNRVPSHHQTPE